MKRRVLFALPVFILFASLFLGGYAHAKHKHAPPWARAIKPIVSTDWLEKNLNRKNLVILDVRTALEYGLGHIPGSISAPFLTDPPEAAPNTGWVTFSEDGLWLEVPNADDLRAYIGSLGITSNSAVVIVTAQAPPPTPPEYGLSSATWVAFILEYAGIKNYGILDGGYPKWVADGLPFDTDVPSVTPVTYEGGVNEGMIVSGEYVRRHLRKIIIDARDADVYYGATIEIYTPRAGHIPSAKCLPAPWIWDLNPDGTYTYKVTETLGAMASGVIGGPWGYWCNWDQEIIVYCGVGGYGSSWWFVLTKVLGYKKVRLYAGSIQEWGPGYLDYHMSAYQWD